MTRGSSTIALGPVWDFRSAPRAPAASLSSVCRGGRRLRVSSADGPGTHTPACQQRELNPELIRAGPVPGTCPQEHVTCPLLGREATPLTLKVSQGPGPAPSGVYGREEALTTVTPSPASRIQVSLIIACWQPLSHVGRLSRARGHMWFCRGWSQSPAWKCQPDADADPGLLWLRLQAEEDSRGHSLRSGEGDGPFHARTASQSPRSPAPQH